MTVIFSDNFEAGSPTGWTSTLNSGTGAMATNATASFSGSFGEDLTVSSSAAGSTVLIKNFTVTSSGITSMSCRWKIKTQPTNAAATPIRFQDGFANNVSYVEVHNGTWRLFGVQKSNAGQSFTVNLTTQPSLNTWYLVELVEDWSTANRVITVYLNNNTVAQYIDTSVAGAGGALQPTRAHLVLDSESNFVSGEIYADEFSLADAYQTQVNPPVLSCSDLPIVFYMNW